MLIDTFEAYAKLVNSNSTLLDEIKEFFELTKKLNVKLMSESKENYVNYSDEIKVEDFDSLDIICKMALKFYIFDNKPESLVTVSFGKKNNYKNYMKDYAVFIMYDNYPEFRSGNASYQDQVIKAVSEQDVDLLPLAARELFDRYYNHIVEVLKL